jgi:hypothetical protein
MKTNIRLWTFATLALGAALFAGWRLASRPAPPAPADAALELGWRFACAITDDDKDLASSQEKIALAYLKAGHPDRAESCAESIANWRKGTTLAAIAAWHAENGDVEKAQALLARAEDEVNRSDEWQKDRIMVQAARTRALLNREKDMARLKEHYEANRDYVGEASAYHALTLARTGQGTNALQALEDLASSTYFDTTVWRAEGYLLVARSGALPDDAVTNALDLAWTSATNIAGHRRLEFQLDVADAFADRGDTERAAEMVAHVTQRTIGVPYPGHIKVPVLNEIALRWARLGWADRVAEVTTAAEALIPTELQNIEQPAAYAGLAEAWALTGDRARAKEYVTRAMDQASQLINLRPRALACVDISLALARSGMDDGEMLQRLDRLLATFGAVGS